MRISYFMLVASLATPTLHAQNDWPTYAHDPGGQRFSPLKQINTSNVTKLVQAWSYQMKKEDEPFRLPLLVPAEDALRRSELVISTGGLGPTLDDLTREAIADLLGRKLLLNKDVLERVEARFRRLGRSMPENNKRQALVLEGASVLENSVGTAPGLWLENDGHLIVLLPGPPAEMNAIFTQHVESRLARLSGGLRLYAREMRVAGLP